jgi:bifunctional non-homologous end joining protein LigD
VERRVPKLATSKWWKEERQGVFIDYNQNARDRTVASAYSVRPTDDARVSAPLAWDEVEACDPRDFTLATMPARYQRIGDPHADIDEHRGSLVGLLELSARQECHGQGDAPWPPQYRKAPQEPLRAPPSKRRKPPGVSASAAPPRKPSRARKRS